MKRKRRIKTVILALLGFLVIGFLIEAVTIWKYAEEDETRTADVAIVLGAAAYESGPSPVYRERLNHGIRLYQEGYVDKIILTGGIAPGNSCSDAAVGGEYVTSHGVPDIDVILEECSTITEENVKNAAKIMNEAGFSSALIVSDPLHMKRAMLMAKDTGIDAYSSPTPTSRYQSLKSRVSFLLRELLYYSGYCFLRFFR